MRGGSVPGRRGWRIDPCGRDPGATVRDFRDREPGEPHADKQRRNRRDASAVCREVAFAAVRGTQCLVSRGKLGATTVTVVVVGVRVGRDCGGCGLEIQTAAMTGQCELGPEQRHHREEGSALKPVPMAKADHDLSLLFSDPVQLIQINFWSSTETAGEFVPMLGGEEPSRLCAIALRQPRG